MGYRSEVVGLVYGEEKRVDEYIALHKIEYGDKSILDIFPMNDDPNELWVDGITIKTEPRQEFGGEGEPPKQVKYKFIKLYGSDWKWYPEYEDVKTWDKFMRSSEVFGLEYEFARIGEESNDVEHITSENAEYMVYISRSIGMS